MQWFSQCLAMLSLGAVELVVPNTQGAGIMAPPFVSAEFLASSLAMLLLLTPRLAGDCPGASDAIAPRLAVAAHGGDVARIPDGAPPTTSTFVPAAAPCDPGLAPLLSTPPQRAAADSVIPKLPPHVLALRELPASAARRAIRLLEAVIKRRRAHVLQVLLNHAVPDELCDPYNLLCGLKGVTFVVEAEGDAAGRGFWRYELKLFNVSTKASRVDRPLRVPLRVVAATLCAKCQPRRSPYHPRRRSPSSANYTVLVRAQLWPMPVEGPLSSCDAA